MGSLRVGHDWAASLSFFTFILWRRKWQPTPVFLPGESRRQGSRVGCCLWGCTESNILKRLSSSSSMHAELFQSCPIFCDPTDIAWQAPLSMGFSRQEYWSGLLCPPLGESSQSRDKTHVSCVCLLHWQADSLPRVPPGKPLLWHTLWKKGKEKRKNTIINKAYVTC